jgi:DnaK suppressor protein
MPTKATDKTSDDKAVRGKSARPKAPRAAKNAVDISAAPQQNGEFQVDASKINPGSSYLSAQDIAYFQGLLLTERARLEEEREQIRSRSGSVDGALPEEGEGGDEDTADLANAMMDKEMDLSVEDEIEDLLAAVDHALQKIEDGTYGICDMSGEKIPRGRLELIPWAALTVECQALAEGQ